MGVSNVFNIDDYINATPGFAADDTSTKGITDSTPAPQDITDVWDYMLGDNPGYFPTPEQFAKIAGTDINGNPLPKTKPTNYLFYGALALGLFLLFKAD